MIGLILKDYFESFMIKKNGISFLVMVLAIALLMVLNRSFYSLCLINVLIGPLIISHPVQASMEQDEISQFDTILLTYPLSKQQIVGAKFLSSCLFALVSWTTSLMYSLLHVFVFC